MKLEMEMKSKSKRHFLRASFKGRWHSAKQLRTNQGSLRAISSPLLQVFSLTQQQANKGELEVVRTYLACAKNLPLLKLPLLFTEFSKPIK